MRTSDGEIVIRGTVGTPGASLTMDGQAVEVAADGRFAVTLSIEGSRDIEVVARAPDGTETRKRVDAVIDEEPPTFELVDASQVSVTSAAMALGLNSVSAAASKIDRETAVVLRKNSSKFFSRYLIRRRIQGVSQRR